MIPNCLKKGGQLTIVCVKQQIYFCHMIFTYKWFSDANKLEVSIKIICTSNILDRFSCKNLKPAPKINVISVHHLLNYRRESSHNAWQARQSKRTPDLFTAWTSLAVPTGCRKRRHLLEGAVHAVTFGVKSQGRSWYTICYNSRTQSFLINAVPPALK